MLKGFSNVTRLIKQSISYSALISLIIVSPLNTSCSKDSYTDASSTPPPDPVVYSGETGPATITLNNTGTILRDLFNSDIYSNLFIPPAESSYADASKTITEKSLSKPLSNMINMVLKNVTGDAYNGFTIPVSKTIDDHISCDNGSYKVKGTVDEPTGTAMLDVVFTNCRVSYGTNYGANFVRDVTYNYGVNIYISSSASYGLTGTMSFSMLSIYTSKNDIDSYYREIINHAYLTGSISFSSTINGNTWEESTILNFDAKDLDTKKLFKYENFGVNVSVDDMYMRDTPFSISFTGSPARLYDYERGYININTISPLRTVSIYARYPDDSGELLITGNNSSVRFLVMSDDHFKLEFDFNDDGIQDAERYVRYEVFESSNYINLKDTDGDGMHNSWEIKYRLDPNTADGGRDPDRDGLTNLEEYRLGSFPYFY